jgi:hypothetical protein
MLFSSLFLAQRIETSGVHEMPPPHTLDHAHDGLQGESHEDIGYAQLENYYLGETHVQISGTLSIIYLVKKNLVPLKIQQIPGIFEYVK